MRATELQLTSRRAVQGALLAALVGGLLLCSWIARGPLPGLPAEPAGGEVLRPAPGGGPAAFAPATDASPAEPEPLLTHDVVPVAKPVGAASCQLRGRVTRAGAPVAGVEVSARQLGGHGLRAVRPWESIITDADGRFAAEFAAEATVMLRAHDARSASAQVVLSTGSDASRDVDLPLLDLFSIRGRLLDEAGGPVPGLYVEARRVGTRPGRESLLAGAPDEQVTTDASGAFELLLPQPGSFRVRVAQGRGDRSTEAVVAVAKRKTPATVELRLTRRGP